MSTDNKNLKPAQEKLARQYFNQTWNLLEKPDRSPEEEIAMIHAAHTSCYLWMQVGTAVNHQRGEWQVSRVYAVIGDASQALRHAGYCLELTENNLDEMADFDIAFAYEAIARANALADHSDTARKYIGLAQQAGDKIKDADDRKVFIDDFNGGEWNGYR